MNWSGQTWGILIVKILGVIFIKWSGWANQSTELCDEQYVELEILRLKKTKGEKITRIQLASHCARNCNRCLLEPGLILRIILCCKNYYLQWPCVGRFFSSQVESCESNSWLSDIKACTFLTTPQATIICIRFFINYVSRLASFNPLFSTILGTCNIRGTVPRILPPQKLMTS